MALNYSKEQVKQLSEQYSSKELIFGKPTEKMLAEDLLQVYKQLDDCMDFYPTNKECPKDAGTSDGVDYKTAYNELNERFTNISTEYAKHLDEYHNTKKCLHNLEDENKQLLYKIRNFKQR